MDFFFFFFDQRRIGGSTLIILSIIMASNIYDHQKKQDSNSYIAITVFIINFITCVNNDYVAYLHTHKLKSFLPTLIIVLINIGLVFIFLFG